MSVQAMAWAWDVQGLSASEKLVLLAIADHADDEGVAFPGIARISTKTGLSRRAIIGIIGRLCEKDLLGKRRRYRGVESKGGRTSSLYQLRLGAAGAHNRLSAADDRLSAAGAPHEPSVEPSVEEKYGTAARPRPPQAAQAEEKPDPTPLPSKPTAQQTSTRKPVTRIPDDWEPDAASREWIESFGVTVEQAKPAIIEFCTYWQGRSQKRADWQLAFRRNGRVESTLLRIAPSAPQQAASAPADYHRMIDMSQL